MALTSMTLPMVHIPNVTWHSCGSSTLKSTDLRIFDLGISVCLVFYDISPWLTGKHPDQLGFLTDQLPIPEGHVLTVPKTTNVCFEAR